MRKFISTIIMSSCVLIFTGCQDLTEKALLLFKSEQISSEDMFKIKLRNDLQAFDRIRVSKNTTFVDLKEKLEKASDKNLSTPELRAELLSLSSHLQSQNNEFKNHHFRTIQVAKMRNSIMELHYTTITLIAIIDNPKAAKSRLTRYLEQQKDLIREYEDLRRQAHALI